MAALAAAGPSMTSSCVSSARRLEGDDALATPHGRDARRYRATPPAQATTKRPCEYSLTARPDAQWHAGGALTADFDCDGRRDQLFLGRASGKVFVGLVRAAAPKPEILEFAVDANRQAAICREPAQLKVESLD